MKLVTLLLAAGLWFVPGARAATWARPVDGPVLRSFALTADRFARGQHRGVDLGAAPGTMVRAACGGRVRFAGSVPGGGRTVSVGCGRVRATYQHLGHVAVRRGEAIARGAPLGAVGRSGNPRGRGPHLHLGAREAASGRYVDPLTLLGGRPQDVPPVRLAPPRAVPLGRAPRPAPRRAVRHPPAVPVTPAPIPDRVGAPAPGLPLAVWAGLAAFGLGLPLGGIVTRRRRRVSGAAGAARAGRWAPTHR